MATCFDCGDTFRDQDEVVVCKKCSNGFHCFCSGFRETSFKNLSKGEKKAWICKNCKSSVSTDVNFHQEILKELKELRKSIEYNSSTIEDLVKSNENLKADIHEVKNQNQNLKDEIKKLNSELHSVKKDVIDLKQYSRRLNIEISNFPESENEDITSIMDSFMTVLGADLKDNLVAYHRVPTMNKNKIKPIIVKFNTAIAKNDFMKKCKQKNILANQINSSLSAEPIYFNDHLCPELKKLLYQCKVFKREKNYKFCWTKSGKIFLRKQEGSKIIVVNSEFDLLNVPN